MECYAFARCRFKFEMRCGLSHHSDTMTTWLFLHITNFLQRNGNDVTVVMVTENYNRDKTDLIQNFNLYLAKVTLHFQIN